MNSEWTDNALSKNKLQFDFYALKNHKNNILNS